MELVTGTAWTSQAQPIEAQDSPDDGVVGWGESVFSPQAAAAYMRARLVPLVLGQDPAQTGRLLHAVSATVGYDRRGAAMMAISAVDMALHDVAARARSVPVSALLGGRLRDRLFAYASGPFLKEGADPYRDMARETDGLLRQGYRALKPRAGADLRADGEALIAIQRQAGPDVGLMVDINQGYTARAAIESARRMTKADRCWLEEPVPPDDVGGYRALNAAVDIAIAGGDALGSLAAFREFLVTDCSACCSPTWPSRAASPA